MADKKTERKKPWERKDLAIGDMIIESKIYKQRRISLSKNFLKKHDLKEGDDIIILVHDIVKKDEYYEMLLDIKPGKDMIKNYRKKFYPK